MVVLCCGCGCGCGGGGDGWMDYKLSFWPAPFAFSRRFWLLGTADQSNRHFGAIITVVAMCLLKSPGLTGKVDDSGRRMSGLSLGR